MERTRYRIEIGRHGLEAITDPNGSWEYHADAQAQIEALQAQVKRHQTTTYCAFCGQTYDLDTGAELIARHIKECPKHPMRDVEQQVEALQRERDELKELTSVICGHCCEPTAIPSRAVLQAALDAERDRLREALRPFAERWEYFERTKHPSGGEWPEDLEYADDEPSAIYLGQLKAAKAVLTPAGGVQQHPSFDEYGEHSQPTGLGDL